MVVFDSDLNLKNKIHCLYLRALGLLGIGNPDDLKTSAILFKKVLEQDANHQGAIAHRRMMDVMKNF